MAEEMMNLSDAADYLGITLVTLRKRIANGKLVAHDDPLDSRQKLVKKSALDTLLISRGIEPTNAQKELPQKRENRREIRKKELPVTL